MSLKPDPQVVYESRTDLPLPILKGLGNRQAENKNHHLSLFPDLHSRQLLFNTHLHLCSSISKPYLLACMVLFSEETLCVALVASEVCASLVPVASSLGMRLHVCMCT